MLLLLVSAWQNGSRRSLARSHSDGASCSSNRGGRPPARTPNRETLGTEEKSCGETDGGHRVVGIAGLADVTQRIVGRRFECPMQLISGAHGLSSVAPTGECGTHQEACFMFWHRKPVVAISTSGGTAELLAGKPLDRRNTWPILEARSAEEAVHLLFSQVDRMSLTG